MKKTNCPCHFNLYCILGRNKKDVTIYESLKILICDHWIINFNWPAPFSNGMLQLLCTSLVCLIITEDELVFTHFGSWVLLVCIMLMPAHKHTHTHFQVDVWVAGWDEAKCNTDSRLAHHQHCIWPIFGRNKLVLLKSSLLYLTVIYF